VTSAPSSNERGLEAALIRVTYLLTELSPSWQAANYIATQELSSVLWNPKVHHRVHKSPPPVPILSQIGQLHASAALPLGKKPSGTQWKGGLVGPRTGLNAVGYRKFFCSTGNRSAFTQPADRCYID
jgi:hypothetical protein